ncbi:tRNA (uracil-5-)-methyltransferase homolog B-like [Macrosteles quadrilineatus]|uniref:tRNA (uracil-5-)-methyltransferase homolog B-like n=1 Tax=Macrosteles quadrilineatus TaxID=74068 RepID=UPI0023E303DA|nr:tRNA (uracil-5-)-methyltransferase homolog B-like [Macrosteles quadrilineatus]XP_054264779.1 tRNA (uracil-5-)-methyltransferase homolog B-like [Macrosteles quadrilineatus]
MAAKEPEQMEIKNESEQPLEKTNENVSDIEEDKPEVKQETIEEESKTQEKPQSTPGNSIPHYRVKISGLPRFYTPTDPLLVDFKRLLANLGLNFKYIRSPKKGNSWLYITFYNQAHQERALKLLRNYKWKGRTLICTLVVADVLKRKQEDSGQEASKKPRLDIPIEEQMLMSTIPYHSISYEEQLSKKNEEAQCLFKWLSVCMEKKTPELIGYIDKQIAKFRKTQLPFKLDMVRASPVIDGYRNKYEFRIGMEPTSKRVIVGYRVDNQEGDNIAVAAPDAMRHLPKEMLEVVKIFEQFVQESPHPPQITNHDPGVWRLLLVRTNKAKQLMVVVMINPTTLQPGEIEILRKQLIDFFTTGPASGKNVVSLYFHTDNDVKTLGGGHKAKRPQGQLELLWGETHIEEQLLDLKLEIDPNFYFQNNTWGAEELYKAVKELAGVDTDTTVLDLCCGSGGMGMMFAKDCKEVIGVEVMDVNVDDAKRLAAKNGLTNCEFLQGSVDDLFPELEEKLKGKKVVPILDPPRAGISAMLISSLRKMKEAQRIVYVCSNHKLPSKNIMDLSLLEGEMGECKGTDPFFPIRVIPVDISPHSLRCELVILLERLDMSKIPKPLRSPMPKGRNFYYQGEWEGKGFRITGHRERPGRGSPFGKRGFRPTPRHMRELGGGWAPAGPARGRRPPPGFGGPPAYDNYMDYDCLEVKPYIPPPPPRANVSHRLAIANAMLERGLRLAEEAMAEGSYGRGPLPPPPGVIPPYAGGYPPHRGGWGGDNYARGNYRGGRGRGGRGNKSRGGWRR